MKFGIWNLKSVAALAIALAGSQLWATAPAETFDQAYQRHRNALGNWSCHSYADDVVKDVPASLAFIAEWEAKDYAHAAELGDLKCRVLTALRRANDFKTGKDVARQLYASDVLSWRSSAAEYLGLAMIDETKDFAGADRLCVPVLEASRKEVPLGRWSLMGMVRARAHFMALKGDKEGALRYVESERAKINYSEPWKTEISESYDGVVADTVYGAFFDYQGAIAYFLAHGKKYRAFLYYSGGKVSDKAAAEKLAHEIVLDDSCSARGRTEAWLWLYSRDGAFCDRNAARCLSGEKNSTNEFLRALSQTICGSNRGASYGKLTPGDNRNPLLLLRLWKHYDATAALLKAPVEFRVVQYAALAHAELGDKAAATAVLDKGLANGKLKPEERFELALMKRTLTFRGSEEEIARAAKAAVVELGKGLPPKTVKGYLQRAFTIATVGRDETLKRGVAKFFLEEVRATPARKVYAVRFSDRPIAGAGDWANLPFKPAESDFDRKYGGGGASFLVTDVASGDRGSAVVGGEKSRKNPTTLQVVADEWGVHFVFTFYDRRARQFESGELDPGGYESYLAPGDNTPYYCFMSHPYKKATASIMNTTYDRPGHRRVNARDPNQFRVGSAFTDDAVVCYSAFSWDAFADRIPTDGTEWDFESIFWGPIPSAWNGTESIHGRSTWGILRFELGEAARTKIVRQQLFAAAKAYKAEKRAWSTSPDSVQEGLFSHWSDPDLGDPDFYAQCLKPLEDELDPVAARVKATMSDADVREIAAGYLARFLNLRYEIARLRSAYLTARLTRP